MKKKTIWLAVSCLIVAALLLASCASAVEEEDVAEQEVTKEEVAEGEASRQQTEPGVKRSCLVYANKGPEQVSLDDPTADCINNGCTIPLGENLEYTPESPELPADFVWSLTVSSGDINKRRGLGFYVLFTSADEAQYKEMIYDVSITYSYFMKATGSSSESAGAHLYTTANTFDVNDRLGSSENVFQRNESVYSYQEPVTTLEDGDTISDKYQLTFKDDMQLNIGGYLEVESKGSGSSEVTFIIERITLTRVD